MNILMVSSECTPYAKSGGLADVVASLSRQLGEMNFDVRILLPYYSFVEIKSSRQIFSDLKVNMGFDEETVSLTETTLKGSNVKVYLLENKLFSERSGIYGNHGSHNYRDNYYRFALLSKTAFVLSQNLKWIPDIIHSHDWPTGLTAAYLNEYRKRDLFPDTLAVFTIHNTGYQGTFSKYDLHPIDLAWESVHSKKAGFKDQINFLRSGIENSSSVTTVSPGYAEEIKSKGLG
ncbi:MAG: glycogen/starch synthase, partial [Spirochaetales bacterium]|nr:glycogen/starch synthase [Spirochaetales bacterium]